MLSLVTSILAFAPPNSVMKLRGGMALGPLTPGDFNSGLKVAAAVTAAGAITEKYADIDGTKLTSLFKGDMWNTNLVISLVTGGASTVLYSVGGAAFDANKLTAVLWLASVLFKLKDNGFDVTTLKDAP